MHLSGFRTCDNLFLLFQEYIHQKKNCFMYVTFKLCLIAFYCLNSLFLFEVFILYLHFMLTGVLPNLGQGLRLALGLWVLRIYMIDPNKTNYGIIIR